MSYSSTPQHQSYDPQFFARLAKIIASCHCRRYGSAELTAVLRETGFEVEYLTQFMMSLFPLVWFLRRVHGGGATTDRKMAAEKAATELEIVPVINGFLKLILTAGAFAVERRWRLPLGTSLLAVARKKRPADARVNL